MTSIALNPTDTLHLVAIDRPQLEAAHAKMLEWVSARLERIDLDRDVERAAHSAAVEHGFATAPFDRRIRALNRQRVFYEKIRVAVEAGYAIVPNFPMTVFAIRTNAKAPRADSSDSAWHRFRDTAQLLPAGDGEYRNPVPLESQRAEKVDDGKGGTKTVTIYEPAEFADDVDFPIALARPELMSRVGQAMAKKLFDEIGVADDAPTGGGRGDPILLGRLRNPRSGAPAISFFLGWYFDPSRL